MPPKAYWRRNSNKSDKKLCFISQSRFIPLTAHLEEHCPLVISFQTMSGAFSFAPINFLARALGSAMLWKLAEVAQQQEQSNHAANELLRRGQTTKLLIRGFGLFRHFRDFRNSRTCLERVSTIRRSIIESDPRELRSELL